MGFNFFLNTEEIRQSEKEKENNFQSFLNPPISTLLFQILFDQGADRYNNQEI